MFFQIEFKTDLCYNIIKKQLKIVIYFIFLNFFGVIMDRSVYKVHKIDHEINIGDAWEDPIWKQAEPTKWYKPMTDQEPISKTEAGILWSDNYIYVGYKAYDRDIFALNTARNSATCQDDVLEFFFNTDPDQSWYYNFEINALNTVYDAYQPKPDFAGGSRRWSQWDCQGLKSAVFIKGKINDPGVEDEYWQLQIAVPFKDLNLKDGKAKPEIGDRWTYMLSRYDYSIYLPWTGVELSATSLLDRVAFHVPLLWNYLEFVK